jgi:homoserine kinase
MALTDSVIVQVPATTANIGPGFDCLGAALTFYNQFQFALSDHETTITVSGKEADKINTDKSNLVYTSFLKFYENIGQTAPKVEIKIQLTVPPARGLGSSATAIIAGLMAANYFAQNPCTIQQIGYQAIAIEGHPDNVIPALLGNCILSVNSPQGWQFIPIPWHNQIIPIVAIPEFELSTKEARKVVPEQFPYNDVIFNISHFGLLIKGLETGNRDWLMSALQDKIHQPYRENLIKGFAQVKKAVISAGAYGMVISGAGPALLALADKSQVSTVSEVLKKTWENQGIKNKVLSLNIDKKGTTII